MKKCCEAKEDGEIQAEISKSISEIINDINQADEIDHEGRTKLLAKVVWLANRLVAAGVIEKVEL